MAIKGQFILENLLWPFISPSKNRVKKPPSIFLLLISKSNIQKKILCLSFIFSDFRASQGITYTFSRSSPFLRAAYVPPLNVLITKRLVEVLIATLIPHISHTCPSNTFDLVFDRCDYCGADRHQTSPPRYRLIVEQLAIFTRRPSSSQFRFFGVIFGSFSNLEMKPKLKLCA